MVETTIRNAPNVRIAASVYEKVDYIERNLNDLKQFLAENEWVLLENSGNIRQFRHPEHHIDPESLQLAFAQASRFERLVLTLARSVDRMTTQCKEFAEVNAKSSREKS
jgi:hypothetical protein